MLFYEKMRKMCDKKATKAFTLLEVLLALSVWSLFITIFAQVLFMVKKAHKYEEVKPLDSFTKILFYVKKGACFKMENDCLSFQTLDTQRVYKICFLEKEFRERDEIFIPIKGLKQAVWSYWDSNEKLWSLLDQESKTTPALRLKLINKENVCFETFIFNTAWPYFRLTIAN